MRLVLCEGCQRHVRDDAAMCPFCRGTARASHAYFVPSARLGRAAWMVVGLASGIAILDACDKKPDAEPNPDVTVGMPSGAIAMPYGAPPDRIPTIEDASSVDVAVRDADIRADASDASKDVGVKSPPKATATPPIDTRALAKPYGAPPIPEELV